MVQKLFQKFRQLPLFERLARIPCYVLAGSFLAIHMIMLVLFFVHGVKPMFYFNIFSILFYISMIELIRRGGVREFVIGSYCEITVHMTLAVCLLGWGCGFQITLIGIMTLIFFAEYSTRIIGKRSISGLPMCILLFAAYSAAYIYTCKVPPMYTLPDNVVFWLQLGWGLIVFTIDILFLQTFVLLTFHSELTLTDKAEHDPLTGLHTRYVMDEYLSDLMEKPERENSWIAMIDIDDFKQINDTYGHNCGDYVLKTLTSIIGEELMKSELCRWGGEEFLAVGRIRCDMSSEINNLDRLRRKISSHHFEYENTPLNITVTIGVAAYENDKDAKQWVERADMKLYQGKRSGKNKVVA